MFGEEVGNGHGAFHFAQLQLPSLHEPLDVELAHLEMSEFIFWPDPLGRRQDTRKFSVANPLRKMASRAARLIPQSSA